MIPALIVYLAAGVFVTVLLEGEHGTYHYCDTPTKTVINWGVPAVAGAFWIVLLPAAIFGRFRKYAKLRADAEVRAVFNHKEGMQ